jgi:heme-degrading monooxygenase HmoA
MLVVLWESRVRLGKEAEFERVYGPDGDWAQLFRQAKGYLGTELVQDSRDDTRYLCLDCWASKADRDAFRETFWTAYDALDKACEKFTLKETHIGDLTLEEALAWVARDSATTAVAAPSQLNRP